ncbi:hypothetical protein F6V30_13925 [Oryzomonas sagensis]|uniref:Uncharacterized protein n=1 Tax=Oryzomonas sagensis TaxID=2603857 RepID=A0ABQ6TLP1_9BACT|nr:hypothetical protein [Oryzomonas sagensis]KAB0668931.1 hypothetical protein F6V30_13925 [Oryzomonas sagensis]
MNKLLITAVTISATLAALCAGFAAPGAVTPIGPSFGFGNISTPGGKITASRPSDTFTLNGVNGTITHSGRTITITGAVSTTDVSAKLDKVHFTGYSTDRQGEIAALQAGKVDKSTTVNGQPLSANVNITTITGNAGTATALQTPRNINGVAFNGTADITVTDSTKVPTATTINGHALTSNVTISASDLTTGTLPHAQLPTLASGDIPNNAANTTGSAAKLATSRNINGVAFDGSANIQTATSATSDYATGTWAPADISGASLTFSGAAGDNTYIKIGKVMFATFHFSYPTTVNASTSVIGGLPCSSINTPSANFNGSLIGGTDFNYLVAPNNTAYYISNSSAVLYANSQLSGKSIFGTIIYQCQ